MYQMIYHPRNKEQKIVETLHSRAKAEEFLSLRETLAKAMNFYTVKESGVLKILDNNKQVGVYFFKKVNEE